MLIGDGTCRRSHQQYRHCLQISGPLDRGVVESDRDIDDCAYEINTVERSMEVLSTVRLRMPSRASHITQSLSLPSWSLVSTGVCQLRSVHGGSARKEVEGNIHSRHAAWDVGADILRWIK